VKALFYVLGWTLFSLGAIWLLAGLALPSGPPFSDTVNLGYIADKMAHMIIGAAVFVVGGILLAAGALIGAVQSVPADQSSSK
jgi:hypothetical protein